MNITERSLQLFLKLARDAGNWNGNPLISLSASERGNLIQLKKAGLLKTEESDGCMFAHFEPAGIALAKEHDVTIEGYGYDEPAPVQAEPGTTFINPGGGVLIQATPQSQTEGYLESIQQQGEEQREVAKSHLESLVNPADYPAPEELADKFRFPFVMTVQQAFEAHIRGAVPPAECPVCAEDERIGRSQDSSDHGSKAPGRDAKAQIVTADWKDTEGLVESFRTALSALGIVMTDDPITAGSDQFGFILSTRPLTFSVYASRDVLDGTPQLMQEGLESLEAAAKFVEGVDLAGNWPEGFDAVVVDSAGRAYEDVAGDDQFVFVGDSQF